MDYQERELEKQYFAEVSLTATYRGQRLVDYDTQLDGDDLDKTQRVAAIVRDSIKVGILPVKVTEKHRNEHYKAPGYIFSKRMYVRQRPTQQAAKETMLAHLKDLISESEPRREPRAERRIPRRSRIDARYTSIPHRSTRNADDWFTNELPWDISKISEAGTTREPRAEPHTPSRPQIDNRHTSIPHRSARNVDDWFTSELPWNTSRISERDTRREPRAELPTLGRPQSDDRHTSISNQSAHNKDDWFENELDWRNSGQ